MVISFHDTKTTDLSNFSDIFFFIRNSIKRAEIHWKKQVQLFVIRFNLRSKHLFINLPKLICLGNAYKQLIPLLFAIIPIPKINHLLCSVNINEKNSTSPFDVNFMVKFIWEHTLDSGFAIILRLSFLCESSWIGQ